METTPGDQFIDDCARFVRYNESKLSPTAAASSSLNGNALTNPISWLFAATPQSTSTSDRSKRNSTRDAIRPTALRLTSHHLYYLLIRFEALGLSIGPLDVQIPSTSRPSSYFAFISNNAAGSGTRRKDREDSMSISSLQTTMSALSIFGSNRNDNSAGGWWSTKKADISINVKYIYSALTRIPSLRIGPPPLKLIQDFEDCPGESSVPLDVFKSVQILDFEDTDPRAFIGWDRLSIQLRSLSIKRSGIEDVTDIIVDAVIQDARRRKGERVRHRRRKIHAPSAVEEEDDNSEEARNTGIVLPSSKSNDTISISQLPSLSWHFLRHLSLADNSLTFLHPTCLSCLSSLTSLDLSSNLMNAVPPSLNLLPNLQSLNLTNNLIDSVMGIPQALPNIKALNLSHNRLESLCGLERLPTLLRIDLRKNELYEAGEVGRLAILPGVMEVYIAGNPLFEEVENARVEVFIEFAKEGKNIDRIKLDNEMIGFFERQKVRERVPNIDRIASSRGRKVTPSADEVYSRGGLTKQTRIMGDAGDVLSSEGHGSDGPAVKTVRHRHTHSQQASNNKMQRRNRRVVDIPKDIASGSTTDAIANKEASTVEKAPIELSDSDAIKRAALAGDTEVAIGAVLRRNSLPPQNNASSTLEQMVIASSSDQKGSKEAIEESTDTQHDTIKPGPRNRLGRLSDQNSTDHKVDQLKLIADDKKTSTSNNGTETDLRRKIEALKGEVGDDWLRLLARGESVYIPSSVGDTDEHSDGGEMDEEEEE